MYRARKKQGVDLPVSEHVSRQEISWSLQRAAGDSSRGVIELPPCLVEFRAWE